MKEVVVRAVDDLELARDGSKVPADREDVRLVFGGQEATLDLTEANYQKLAAVLGEYLGAAEAAAARKSPAKRKSPGKRGPSSIAKMQASRARSRSIRAYAKQRGMDTGEHVWYRKDRGWQFSEELLKAYAENGP